MKKKKWFISHPSQGQQHMPMFFFAIDQFREAHPEIEISLPHEKYETLHLTHDEIKKADVVVAEVSFASTGSGIELGWANAAEKRVVAFKHIGVAVSPSIDFITEEVHVYANEEDVITVLNTLV